MRKILVVCCFVLATLLLTACQSKTDEEAEDLAQIKHDETYLVLVNKQNKLPSNWLDKIELVEAENSLGEKMQIETEALACFEAMREELQKVSDIDIELDSVYRSIDEQQEIWDEWLEEKGEDYCKKYLAEPGFSEHHTGLALDIFVIKGKKIIRENEDMIADVEDFAVIHEMLPKYGFILRYMQDKEDITGYSYEPWHLRYISDPEIAQTITDQGITLEEYLEQ